MKYFLLLVLGILFSVQGAFADTLMNEMATKSLSNKATKLIADGKTKEAMELLKKYWPLPASEIDDLLFQIQDQMSIVTERFGKPLEIEFVKKQKIGKSYIRYTYIEKHERHAIRWQFTFYRPEKTWMINAVNFDDSISEMFE